MTDRESIDDRSHVKGDPRQRRRDAKRATIVAEAWELARHDGLAAISLRDLAARVDLRQPSLYAYFDSKLALYDAMYADGYKQLLEMAAAEQFADDAREALIQFVELCVRFSTQDVVRHQLLFQRTVPGFKPSTASRRLALAFQEYGRERLFAIGMDVRGGGKLADIFTAIVVGFTQQQVIHDPGGDRWLSQVRPAMDMFLAEVDRDASSAKKRR